MEENAYQIVVGKPEEMKPLEPLLVYNRIILKYILKKWGVRV
jgi:hypothetical protein